MNDKKQREEVEPVPRIKITPQYDWTQDINSLRVRIPILNSNIKNIIVEVTDLILKVNATDKKLVKTLDLWDEVQLEGVSVVYANNILEVMLLKRNKQLWPKLLVEDMDKVELIQRRQESFTRKDKLEQEYNQKVKDLKIEFDQHATREQMRIEDIERNKISEVKKNIKEKALDEIFSSNDQQKNIQYNAQQNQIKYDTAPDEVAIVDVERQEKVYELNKQIDEIEEQYRRQPKQAIVTNEGYDRNINIFDGYFSYDSFFHYLNLDKDFQKPIVLPEVRKVGGGGAIQLEFTERIYPNLAVREQHYKDAPLPKQNKKFSKDDRENNPLFLKDKGDDFFKNKDYYSAINAYGQAFRGNGQLFQCLTNRSVCFLMVFNLNQCISDCDMFLEIYEKEQEKQSKLHKLYLKTLFRKGIALGWKGMLDISEKIFNQIIHIINSEIDLDDTFKDEIRAQVTQSLSALQQRRNSQQSKRQGDNCYKASSYQKAIEYYMKSIQIDQNEFAYGNLGLVYLKQENLAQSLINTDISINMIQRFLKYSNPNPSTGQQGSQSDSYDFILKLYMRKAKCLFLNQNFDDALQAIKSAISLDEMNKEARDILSQIQRSQKRVDALKLKQEATLRLREGKLIDSITLYNECLQKFTPQEDLIDLLEVLLNKCICCMGLDQFDDVLGACVRGIKLITQQKNKVLSFEKLKNEDRQKFNDYHIRFLVRRSNAYIKLNQIYHAKVDLEEALKLDPKNIGIESDLQKIKKII